jgi:hypothetical protein
MIESGRGAEEVKLPKFMLILCGLFMAIFLSGLQDASAQNQSGTPVKEEDQKKTVKNGDTGGKEKAEEDEKKVTWERKMVMGINLTQSAYSNWAKGGENSIAWSVRLDGDFKRNGGNWDWRFTNVMVFGQTKQQGESPRTTLDKIDIDGTVALKRVPYLNPYFSLGIMTQFSKGYNYKLSPPQAVSNFWDPAYVEQGLGARVKVKSVFDSHLGVGLKQTFTNHFRQYSDDPDTPERENLKFETGIQSKTNLNANLFANFHVKSKLQMFSNFENLNIIDVIWDTLFTAKLNKYIVVTVNLQMNYDKDLIDKVQFKEVTGIGLSYSII